MKKSFYITLLASLISIALLSSIANRTWAEIATPDAPNSSQAQTVLPDRLEWSSNPAVTRVQSAIAWGNSTDSELCILFGKMNPGTAFPAHTHPDPRITTVLAGTMYYGIGEQFDRAELRPYPVGTVVYTPAGTPHFMWTAGDESMMQETEVGPTGLSFVAGAESGQ